MGQKIEVRHQRTIKTIRKADKPKSQKKIVLRRKNKSDKNKTKKG